MHCGGIVSRLICRRPQRALEQHLDEEKFLPVGLEAKERRERFKPHQERDTDANWEGRGGSGGENPDQNQTKEPQTTEAGQKTKGVHDTAAGRPPAPAPARPAAAKFRHPDGRGKGDRAVGEVTARGNPAGLREGTGSKRLRIDLP